MAEIESKTEHKRARFRFDDGKISVHFDYKNGKYTGIRMWKLWQYIPIKLFLNCFGLCLWKKPGHFRAGFLKREI